MFCMCAFLRRLCLPEVEQLHECGRLRSRSAVSTKLAPGGAGSHMVALSPLKTSLPGTSSQTPTTLVADS